MSPWWSRAVFYQVYPRSFADSDGDGVGDLGGVREKMGYLELLGVDALWICPVMRSPQADGGYDVSDPRDIDPLFGGLATRFTALTAHKEGTATAPPAGDTTTFSRTSSGRSRTPGSGRRTTVIIAGRT